MASELFKRIINAYAEIAEIRNMPDSVKDYIRALQASIDDESVILDDSCAKADKGGDSRWMNKE